MLRLGHNLKILGTVIVFVVINMMDNLAAPQCSTNNLLRYDSMSVSAVKF